MADYNVGQAVANITDFLTAIVDVFPPILQIVVIIIPILLIFVVVGFITGLFDKIFAKIGKGMKWK